MFDVSLGLGGRVTGPSAGTTAPYASYETVPSSGGQAVGGFHSPTRWAEIYFILAAAFIAVGYFGAPPKYRGAVLVSGAVILAWDIIWHTLFTAIAARLVAESSNGHGAAEAALSVI